MDQIAHLVVLIETYCAAMKIAEATLSSRLFNDGKRIASIRGGSDIGVRRCREAMQWFSDNWPDVADWPDGVMRPEKMKEAAE